MPVDQQACVCGATPPTYDHTPACRFEHFLCYSNVPGDHPLIEVMRVAYYHGTGLKGDMGRLNAPGNNLLAPFDALRKDAARREVSTSGRTELALLELCGVDGTVHGERLADDAILYVSRSTGRFTPARITIADIASLLQATSGHTLDCLRWQLCDENLGDDDKTCNCDAALAVQP